MFLYCIVLNNYIVLVFNHYFVLLHFSNWSSCTRHISSCWSAALRSKRPVFKLPRGTMAAPSHSSEWTKPVTQTSKMYEAPQLKLMGNVFLIPQRLGHGKLAFHCEERPCECLQNKISGEEVYSATLVSSWKTTKAEVKWYFVHFPF